MRVDADDAVDLRRVGGRARDARRRLRRASTSTRIVRADLAREARRADALLHCHEARAALLAYFFGNGIGQGVGRGAFDRRVGEAADAVELRFLEEVEQLRELRFRLARESPR